MHIKVRQANPNMFGNIKNSENLSSYRFTVDYPEDFEFVKLVYENLYHENPNFGMDDIIKLLKKKPELLDINSKYVGFYNIDAPEI